jgi:hypothetical protein
MAYGVEPFKKDQFEGAVPTIYAATVADKSGQYICAPAIPEEGSEMSRSEELADRLMEFTRDVIKEKMGGEQGGKGGLFDDLELY